tara:strand:- start:214 stop:1143 length:930 start_codon:yes stop_codon:yes gene_type:complete
MVTGCAGFIGTHVVEKLIGDGHRVIGIDAMTYAANPYIRVLEKLNESFSLCEKNIGSVDSADMQGIDLVVNLAAESHVDNSIKSSKQFIDTNVVQTDRLLSVIREHDVPLLHFSTDEVYGVTTMFSFDENAPLNPRNPYSATKAAADHLISAYQNTFGMKSTIIRPSNNFGPRQNGEKFIPTILNKLRSGEKIPIYGKGQQIREWTFVEHTASAVSFLCDKILQGECLGEIYNFTTSNEMKNVDLVQKICTMMDVDYESSIEYVPDRLGHDFRYSIDSTKLSELGFVFTADMDKELEKTINYYCEESNV